MIFIGTYRNDVDLITRCVLSIKKHVTGDHHLCFVDDSDTPSDSDWGRLLEGWGRRVYRGSQSWGFSGALKVASDLMRHNQEPEGPYFCWWEEDTTATGMILLDNMADALRHDPTLAQIALQRQPIWLEEKAAGSVAAYLGAKPRYNPFTPCEEVLVQDTVFTTNPAVWAPVAYAEEWPQVEGSEAAKTRQLKVQGHEFGYVHGQLVEHHGELKQGSGY